MFVVLTHLVQLENSVLKTNLSEVVYVSAKEDTLAMQRLRSVETLMSAWNLETSLLVESMLSVRIYLEVTNANVHLDLMGIRFHFVKVYSIIINYLS